QLGAGRGGGEKKKGKPRPWGKRGGENPSPPLFFFPEKNGMEVLPLFVFRRKNGTPPGQEVAGLRNLLVGAQNRE
ncbi:hypothetical protein VZ191_24515, partial [Enterobacter roggenkampii]|uniref:hypothetical protein n=1 Tax=Enterobacter roggenkampii TaxID=1812935 RepID=UPI002E2DCBA2